MRFELSLHIRSEFAFTNALLWRGDVYHLCAVVGETASVVVDAEVADGGAASAVVDAEAAVDDSVSASKWQLPAAPSPLPPPPSLPFPSPLASSTLPPFLSPSPPSSPFYSSDAAVGGGRT